MKTRIKPGGRHTAGYALLMVLIVAAVSILALTATMSRNASDAKMNERNNLYVVDLFAAEAAVEKVVGRMKVDYFAGGDGYITNNLSIYRAMRPLASEDAYWGNFQFSDGQGGGNSTYVQCISNKTFTALQSQYAGLKGWTSVYRVLSNTRQTGGLFNLTNAVQEDMEFDSLPVFQFAIFYNGLLEFTWAATLTVRGRTHANGNIFVGSSSPLTFSSTVTSTGSVLKTNWAGHTLAEYTGAINYNGNPGYSTNAQVLTLPVGTNNTAAAVREIINIPPDGEDVTSAIGEQRYFNKAEVVLLVSNTTVTVSLKISPSDTPTVIQANYYPTNSAASNYVQIATNFPFLTLTNRFTDQREASKSVKTTQIDVGAYKNWLVTNAYVTTKFPAVSGVLPNVLYVADNRTNSSTELVAVRLNNGIVIPTNTAPSGAPTGFTVATPNPLYILGNYNCPDAAALGTTNTAKTFPASLISDALTILSPTWSDAASAGSYTGRNANDTTVNAAILTGIVYSTGPGTNQFSGGVMNLPRLLEDWGGNTLTLNSSIVNLFDSVRATNQFKLPGNYYAAPTRAFNFDQNFMSDTKLPPGSPLLGYVIRSKWAVPPPNTTTYAGQ